MISALSMGSQPLYFKNNDYPSHKKKNYGNYWEKKSIESFVGSKAGEIGIPLRLIDHLELVDWTGRINRDEQLSSWIDAAQLMLPCRRY